MIKIKIGSVIIETSSFEEAANLIVQVDKQNKSKKIDETVMNKLINNDIDHEGNLIQKLYESKREFPYAKYLGMPLAEFTRKMHANGWNQREIKRAVFKKIRGNSRWTYKLAHNMKRRIGDAVQKTDLTVRRGNKRYELVAGKVQNITIPSKDREGRKDEARLYGDAYWELEEAITEIIKRKR